ncbi:MAG: class I SAM-dependent methyltransferase [Actinomycetota bacterium]|nr:class I SAM-dependent methyltransferase [Actinomycetota bacterium]MDQ2982143.1 class I SAM-dependent methyltransferase [Actinomycetota bacterium]
MSSSDLPDSVARNIADWTKSNEEYTDAKAAEAWAADDITWGVFGVPESELGCGTAYFSAWLAKRGARPVGVDPTPAQLATARRMQDETGIRFPLVEAPGEAVPLPDASFDLAVSEYGASLWAVPERWLAEAARLLRAGGRLVFLTNSTLVILCGPDQGVAEERLLRPQFDSLYRIEWPGEIGVEYHPTHGEWIRLLREHGFDVEALHELQAPDERATHTYYDFVTVEWAQKWPCEDLWVARKRG